MYLTSNFQFKPVNPQKILNQYKRINSKVPSATQADRAHILKYMTDNPIEILSHEVQVKGKTRRPITGLAVIKDSNYNGFPASHVAYIASAPVKSPLAKNGAVRDLGDNLVERLGDNGMFDLTPNNAISKEIYKKELDIDDWGMGSTRGIKKVQRTRKQS